MQIEPIKGSMSDSCHVGTVRISHFDNICMLKQIYVLPRYQNNGYAQQAIRLVEKLYPNIRHWELDTIKQEAKQ